MLTYFEEEKREPKRLDAMWVLPDDKEDGSHWHRFPTNEDMERSFYDD